MQAAAGLDGDPQSQIPSSAKLGERRFVARAGVGVRALQRLRRIWEWRRGPR